MDEADYLGDNIAIMANGSLHSEGSPIFLKNKYSVGYKLTLSINIFNPNLQNLIQENIPSAKLIESGSNSEEISFCLPIESINLFENLFSQLEESQEELGIRGYGITVTTLEEVFLRIVQESEMNKFSKSFNLENENINLNLNQNINLKLAKKLNINNTSLNQFISLITKRFHNAKRDKRTICLQIFTPIVCITLAMLLIFIDFIVIQNPLEISGRMYKRQNIGDMYLDSSNCNVPNSKNFDFSGQNYLIRNISNINNVTLFEKYLLETYNFHDNERFISQYCSGTINYLFYNLSSFHSPAEIFQYWHTSDSSSSIKNNPNITFTNYPLPPTTRQAALFSSIRTFTIGLVIMIPFTFIPSTFVAWIVKEKESKAKLLQIMAGMSYYVYWFSNFVFDICSYLITEFFVIIIFFIFNREEYIGDVDLAFATILTLLIYGLSGIGMAYLLSHYFEEHSTAQNIVLMGNFVTGFVLVGIIATMELFEGTADIAKILVFIFRCIPSFCLGDSIINIATLSFFRTFGLKADPWAMDVTGWNFVYMSVLFPVFMGLALIYDHPKRKRSTQVLSYKPYEIPPPLIGEDEDVKKERERIQMMDHRNESSDKVIVKNLRKEFEIQSDKKIISVKNLTFGIKQNEIFGFLGTNGAGKTTTISILCGEQLPTMGQCFISGYDVVDELDKAQKNIGYCPQFDACLDLLTPKEHLQLYAGLRGITKEDAFNIIQDLLFDCNLIEHQNTLAMNLSGGNKRKLSLAISLIGSPEVVFLDEPSAGMDPVSRRGLWQLINEISKSSTIILCTHHLEEVEALANRVAIMVDGEIKCIGDKTHLKNKFGTGFEMQVSLQNVSFCETFENFVKTYIPNSSLREHNDNDTRYNYALPSDIKLSKVFKLLVESKENLGIIDYAVSQTSIEQVFLQICEKNNK
jgi:ATP-binding cassette subfamily A (ABC1) protein 3